MDKQSLILRIKKQKVKLILQKLYKVYPNPRTALEYTNPLELLVATILSAQATDKSVNIASPALFKKYKTAKDYADSDLKELDSYITNVNFHQNKAKLVKAMGKMLVEKFNGEVPDNMEDLDSLPGVARKTANVVLGNAFKKAEGIVVDTHVMRLSQKLGLTKEKDPVKIEKDLMEVVPKDKWIDFAHLLINYGREFCPARPHVCKDCPLGNLCPDL
ncbi:endonuclease III [Candidatus Daviesbacteria bacterium]|nr:endonuclease III [Candidatus Daviesbacteria bacterium]